MTLRMETLKIQASEKVWINKRFDIAFKIVMQLHLNLICLFVELMIGEPNGEGYEISRSLSITLSTITLTTTVLLHQLTHLLNW